MTACRELIERLEKATGPDVDLDYRLEEATNPVLKGMSRARVGGWWPEHADHDEWSPAPREYTASIDAAVSLVTKMLPTRDYDLTLTLSNPAFSAVAHIEHWDGGEWFAQKQTAPLAILIALLRALEAQSMEEER